MEMKRRERNNNIKEEGKKNWIKKTPLIRVHHGESQVFRANDLLCNRSQVCRRLWRDFIGRWAHWEEGLFRTHTQRKTGPTRKNWEREMPLNKSANNSLVCSTLKREHGDSPSIVKEGRIVSILLGCPHSLRLVSVLPLWWEKRCQSTGRFATKEPF